MPDDGKVKCADCGYLALRHSQTRRLMDAESQFRTRGFVPSPGRASIDHTYDLFPICFVRAFDLLAECGGNAEPSEGKRQEVANKLRICNSFTPWTQGFTPKEHYEMIQQAELQQAQDKREEADRKWRAEESARQRDWQAAEAEKADNRHRETLNAAMEGSKANVWSNIWAGVIGAAGAVIGAIAGGLLGYFLGANR